MTRISPWAMATSLGLSAAMGAEWQGKVVDMGRSGLPEAKVTLHPSGLTAFTDGNGTYRLVPASARLQPAAPRQAIGPAGLRMGLGPAAALPVRDLAGRRLRPEGQGWFFFASLPSPPPVPPVLPLAKVSDALVLTAEKPGFQTARLTLAAGGLVPDIVLAPGIDLSRPLPPLSALKPALLPGSEELNHGITRSTYTDLPGTNGGGTVRCVLEWHLHSEAGVTAYIRPHVYFPGFPEKSASTGQDGKPGEQGYDLFIRFKESAWSDGGALEPRGPYSEYVNLILRKPGVGTEYGTMKWLQYLGPIPRSDRDRLESPRPPSQIRTIYTGSVPPLDTCGRLAGKVHWKGPGPLPELWFGMPGTELFAAVAPDGTFLSTDLPPGRPPVVLVRVDRDTAGAAVPRAFHALEGLEVIPGQTAVLDSIFLSTE